MSTSERAADPWPAGLAALGGHAHLVRELMIAHFKVKDQSTVVGFAWSLLHPLLMLGVLFLFFNSRIGRDIPHYAIFLLIGVVHYTHFSNSTSTAVNVLAVMRQLTAETIFPKAILVVASVLADAAELAVAVAICLVLAVLSGVTLTPAVALLPLVVILQIWTVLWLSLLLACARVFSKDVGHIYAIFLRVLFFVTPTFYSMEFLGGGIARYVVAANPLAHFIHFSRTLIIDGEPMALAPLAGLCAVNAAATWIGLRIFRRYEPVFAERV